MSVLISGMVAVGLGIAAAEMVRRAVREQTASQQFLCKSLCKPFCEVTGAHRWQSQASPLRHGPCVTKASCHTTMY